LTLATHAGQKPSLKEPGDVASGRDRKFVVALARGLEVLRVFRAHDGLLGNTEIAERTGLPKPTVSRLTYTLTELGYLTHLPRFSKYQLAPAAMALGYTALAHIGIRHIARPYMQGLADYANASVALGTRDRLGVIYVQHCLSSSTLKVRLDVGSRIPIGTTAIGRALISAMPDDERDELFGKLAERAGDGWPRMRDGILKASEDIRRYGFTLSVGEWLEDVNGVAVPIVMPDGSGVYAFNCGAPSFSLSREQLVNHVGPRLLEVARTVESILSGRSNGLDEEEDYGTPVFQGGSVAGTKTGGRGARQRRA
jgi:DNA-binding IclR family transcriptional regulator